MRGLLESLAAFLRDQPEEVLDLDAARYAHADRLEVRVDPLAQLVVLLEATFACRRFSVQTLQTVISVSAPVASPYARMRAFRWR